MNKMKKEGKLRIEEYKNGVVLPRKMVDNGPMWGLGGVCDSNNNFVAISFYDGGWAKHGGYYEWDDEEYIDCDVVYIGMFYQHWGHFLIDLTGRMWFLQRISNIRSDFKVAYLGDEIPQGNNLRFFELLGVREEQLLHIQKPTRFKKVFVPEQSFKSCEWYTEEFVQMFDDMCATVLNSNLDFSKLSKVKKIYLTRRKFSKAIKSEFGESFFEKCFLNNGFISIAPENLTLDEQIYLWNNADEIVCINGTIPLNVVFSQNKELKLIVLNKMSFFHENPMILLQMRGISAEFVNVYKEPMKKYPKSLGEGPYLLWLTKEYSSFCDNNNIKVPCKKVKSFIFFYTQQMIYYFSIIISKIKIREILSKYLPDRIKYIMKRIIRL